MNLEETYQDVLSEVLGYTSDFIRYDSDVRCDPKSIMKTSLLIEFSKECSDSNLRYFFQRALS